MTTLILEPEFYVDFAQKIHTGPIAIKDGHIIPYSSLAKNHVAQKIKLKNQVLLPGFVNTHSHSFQRVLRGLVERNSPGQHNFWTWRQKMYEIANALDPEIFEAIATLLYLEMLEAGFSHVGEFHYVHHDVGGKAYKDPIIMSRALLKAAKNTGINLCLLQCAYNQNYFNDPIRPEQKRFAYENPKDFLQMVDLARTDLLSDHCQIGLAIHSVRTVPESWYQIIADYAKKHHLPLHIHASEQESEVADCKKLYGISPIAVLDKNHLLTPLTTLIHAIHLIDQDIEKIQAANSNICLCPSTEKNLGDGIINLSDIFDKNIRVSLGSDQHIRLDPFHEAQSLEELERLRLKKRCILNHQGQWLYQILMPTLNYNGMASLYPTLFNDGLFSSEANLIAIDLPPEYDWHGPHAALDAILLNHNASKISTVISRGHIVVQDYKALTCEKSYLIKIIRKFFHDFISY